MAKPHRRVTVHCLQCQTAFEIRECHFKRGEGKFCSNTCYHEHKRAQLASNFWGSLQKTETCWLWPGKPGPGGYGRTTTANRKAVSTHRLAWELANGPIPDGLWVLHKCDVRICCRPDHLFLGTYRDNIDDMMAKDRSLRGERNYHAILRPEDIPEIRRLAAEGISHPDIAKRYGVKAPAIHKVVTNRSWKHIV